MHFCLSLLVVLIAASARASEFQDVSQLIPSRFLPEKVSTSAIELAPALSPDGREFCFTRMLPGEPSELLMLRYHEDSWSEAVAFEHAAPEGDAAACYSPDGQRLYFLSKRPRGAGGAAREHFQIWYCERRGNSWAEPQDLDLPLTSRSGEGRPALTESGLMYYVAEYPDLGGTGVYQFQLDGSRQTLPEYLPAAINSCGKVAVEPCVTADGSCMIFYSAGREDNQSQSQLRGDLYYSCKNAEGWSMAQPFPFPINTGHEESMPFLAADGRTLLFTSDRTPGQRFPDVYRVLLSEDWIH